MRNLKLAILAALLCAFVAPALASTFTVTTVGGTTQLTVANAANSTIAVTGTLTGNSLIVIPAESGTWTVNNTTTGNFAVEVTIAGVKSSGNEVLQGGNRQFISDGVRLQPASSLTPIPAGTATFTIGTNVTSVVCATGFNCTNARGTITIVGGTATTGTIATVNFSATLGAAPMCFASINGGAANYDIGNSAPTTAGFNITAGATVVSATLNVNYICQP